jgi:hypothetical protein
LLQGTQIQEHTRLPDLMEGESTREVESHQQRINQGRESQSY